MSIENLDWYMTIAKQHLICEDYALTGWTPVPYMIVCDGCSSSEHTDVGARLLAWRARAILQGDFSALLPERERQFPSWEGQGVGKKGSGKHEVPEPTPNPSQEGNWAASPPDYEELGYAVARQAEECSRLLRINSSCLDATLLLAMYRQETCYVYVYGDGYIITLARDNRLAFTQVSFAQNMPYYLTYWMNAERRAAYIEANRGERAVKTVSTFCDGQEQTSSLREDAPLVFAFSDRDYQLVALASDGVSALMSTETNAKIPVQDVIAELVGYKTIKGDFVKRRAKRMLKEYEKQGIAPTDDLSIATMLLRG